MAPTTDLVGASPVTAPQHRAYQQDGFAVVRQLIPREEALAFGEASLSAAQRLPTHGPADKPQFTQNVNVWTQDETMRRLTLDPRVAGAAEGLAGAPLRLWHDQSLIKQPGRSTPTEYHQDQKYWPHENAPDPISCWIALCDVPVERGCMSFLPGSHRWTDLPPQNLKDPNSLFEVAPELAWNPRVTVPLRAGDCTFHHGLCAHSANANVTEDPRVAHVVIFTDLETQVTGRGHPAINDLGLEAGQTLPDERCPPAAQLRD